MTSSIKEIWLKLESDAASNGLTEKRMYKRLDFEYESGIRLGYTLPEKILEILIQIEESDSDIENLYPKWRGMTFETIVLDIPRHKTKHIRLFLTSQEHRDIFIIVCEDLILCLRECKNIKQRKIELIHFLKRWSRFFERCGYEGLSQSQQMGLFGELFWLNFMIEKGVDINKALISWKGCEHGYHDFVFGDRVLEVKTTRTKEPQKVRIGNERQLDDQGFRSLHLFILTLHSIRGNENSLPELVDQIRRLLGGSSASAPFERSLIKAGYLDVHAAAYSTKYVVKKKELFQVQNGFPRIIRIPEGTGDLSYSITVSACKDFNKDIPDYLQMLSKE